MPKEYGAWNTFYVRMRRWEKKGIFAKAFARLQELQIVKVDFKWADAGVGLDSTTVKAHLSACGAQKKVDHSPSEKTSQDGALKCIFLPQMRPRA